MTTGPELRDALRALIVAHGSFDEAKRPCGTELSMPYAHALLVLREHGGLSVTELSAHLNIDRSNVSRLAARMVEDGILERRSHPRDGRAIALFLTEIGRERADGVDQTSAAHFGSLVDALGDDADEVVAALELLRAAMERE